MKQILINMNIVFILLIYLLLVYQLLIYIYHMNNQNISNISLILLPEMYLYYKSEYIKLISQLKNKKRIILKHLFLLTCNDFIIPLKKCFFFNMQCPSFKSHIIIVLYI